MIWGINLEQEKQGTVSSAHPVLALPFPSTAAARTSTSLPSQRQPQSYPQHPGSLCPAGLPLTLGSPFVPPLALPLQLQPPFLGSHCGRKQETQEIIVGCSTFCKSKGPRAERDWGNLKL